VAAWAAEAAALAEIAAVRTTVAHGVLGATERSGHAERPVGASVLTSIYRVTSLIVLGGLLLLGAFAYQRLRPPPLPDIRTGHPSQR
jgi:hypothetical protein